MTLMGIRRSSVLLCVMVGILTGVLDVVAADPPSPPVSFTRDVVPLLRANCLACHREGESEGGLILESLAKLRQGGDSGPVIISGNPDESLLWQLVSGVEEPLMPPEDNTVAAKKLNEEQLAILKSWIEHDDGKLEEDSAAMTPLVSQQWAEMPPSVRSIGAIDVSADGTTAAIAQANRVKVVDLADASKVLELVDEQVPGGNAADFDVIQAIRFAPDGNTLVTGGYRAIRIWTKTTSSEPNTSVSWQLKATVGGPDSDVFAGRVMAIDVHPDGKHVVVGGGMPSRSGEIRWVDLETGSVIERPSWSHSDCVNSLRFSPNGELLASASVDETIGIWNVTTDQAVRSLEGHTGHVLALDWHDDGNLLASASSDKTIRVWDTGNGETKSTINGFDTELTSLEFVRGSNQVLVGGGNGQVRVYDSSTGGLVQTITTNNEFVFSIAVVPGVTEVLAGGNQGDVRSWNFADAKELKTLLGSE